MAAFVFTDVQIAPGSPLGLVIKPGSDNTDTDNTDTNVLTREQNLLTSDQWVINIGGIVANGYTTGVQVPASVVIFGVAGGYLRFLYYTSTKERKGEKQIQFTGEQGKQQINEQSILLEEPEPFFEALKDLSLFFLSPLLAIAVWLVLTQAGTTSIFTLAAISFTVGLITKEVVDSLIKFVRARIAPPETKDEK